MVKIAQDLDQDTLKEWSEKYEEPEYSIGDRVKFEDSTWRGSEDVVGTVIGVIPECVGEEWIYRIITDKKKYHSFFTKAEESKLEEVESTLSKSEIMSRFARRIHQYVRG